MLDQKLVSMREKLKAYNPNLGLPEVTAFLTPIGYLMNLDDQRFWAPVENREIAINAIHGLGVPSIGDTGLVIARRGREKVYGSAWEAYSTEFFEGLNSRENDELDILNLAMKLDAKNRTQLIIENSNAGNYFIVPDKSGKSIKDLSMIRTPCQKRLFKDYSLFRVFGEDYKAKLVDPKELSEKLLARWATVTLLPNLPSKMYANIWNELKGLGKECGENLISEAKAAMEGRTSGVQSKMSV